MTDRDLLDAALRVRQNAHAPYSGYRVGAAVLDERGEMHLGCNVENSSFPEGACAETNAIGAMLAGGGKRITRIAVAGGADDGQFADFTACTPCGGCRQRIREFSDRQTRILMLDADGNALSLGIDDLLPDSFRIKSE